jgi:ParB/RepB/Spo0J family partition protein
MDATATPIVDLPIVELVVDPTNPRETAGDVTELAASIADQGILSPLLVRPLDGVYGVYVGQRRLAAALELGLTTVPCIVNDLDDAAAAVAATADNVSARSLNPVEEARAYQDLSERGMTHRGIAAQVGVSVGTVSKRIVILRLDEDDLAALAAGRMSFDAAYRIAKDPDQARKRARHGTRARYAAGCTCDPCRRANADRQLRHRHGERAVDFIPRGTTPVPIPNDVIEQANAAAARAEIPLAHWIVLVLKDRLRKAAA